MPTFTCASAGSKLFIKQTAKYGRGVYAGEDIHKGALIERCPVLFVGGLANTMKYLMTGEGLLNLEQYVFMFEGMPALALGYGCLYNHSYSPNASYDFIRRTKEVKLTALRNIAKGEQLFIDYGQNEDDLKAAWKKFAQLRT